MSSIDVECTLIERLLAGCADCSRVVLIQTVRMGSTILNQSPTERMSVYPATPKMNKASLTGPAAIAPLTTLASVNMFSELRKYRVGFAVAHQYMHQLEPEIRHAVLGNAGTLISFRVGAEDAPYIAREFSARFTETDLIQIENHRIYLKLMIDGMPSVPFSAQTLPAF